ENFLSEHRRESLDLAAFLGREHRELVVGFDRFEWLDENGLTRPGTVMDDAGHARAGGSGDRQAVTVVALDDDRVGQRVLVPLEQARPFSADLGAAAAKPPSDLIKLGGGFVPHGSFLVEEAAGS